MMRLLRSIHRFTKAPHIALAEAAQARAILLRRKNGVVSNPAGEQPTGNVDAQPQPHSKEP